MKREIKFRGLRKDGKGWVVGSLINNMFFDSKTGDPAPYILNSEECDDSCCSWEDLDDDYGLYSVIPGSVGQFTGLKDKNGVDIYDGDVINWFDVIGLNDGQGVLRYDVENSRWELDIVGDEDDCVLLYDISFEDIQVVENIYEEGGEE